MVLKRARGYEDIGGSSDTTHITDNGHEIDNPDVSAPPEIEMASVSVVPDGV